MTEPYVIKTWDRSEFTCELHMWIPRDRSEFTRDQSSHVPWSMWNDLLYVESVHA